VDVTWILWLVISIALPLASLTVLIAGLLRRGDRPMWLLGCAAAVPAAALVILLALLRVDGDDSLLLALVVWFALCLLVLGLALGRRWRGERSRPLEVAGLVMPFVVLACLAGLFALELLTPPPMDEHPAVLIETRAAPLVADVAPGATALPRERADA
jgi:hypothetical protein